jgi:hypothetical protein
VLQVRGAVQDMRDLFSAQLPRQTRPTFGHGHLVVEPCLLQCVYVDKPQCAPIHEDGVGLYLPIVL